MRVVSVHPARDPVACGNGPIRIGNAADDDIVPAGAGVDPHHVTLAADARGLVLAVRSGCQRVYVNARPVRRRALLRHGDTLTVGANKLLITSDTAPPPIPVQSATGGDHSPVALRVVSGAASGQALAVAPELRVGAGSRHFADLAYACRIAQTGMGVVFESDSAASRINGWHCSRANLAPGDQITLGEHRLVVEAPGMEYAAHAAALPPPPPVPPPVIAEDDSAHTEVWWLIAAGAVLAAIIALLLYSHW